MSDPLIWRYSSSTSPRTEPPERGQTQDIIHTSSSIILFAVREPLFLLGAVGAAITAARDDQSALLLLFVWTLLAMLTAVSRVLCLMLLLRPLDGHPNLTEGQAVVGENGGAKISQARKYYSDHARSILEKTTPEEEAHMLLPGGSVPPAARIMNHPRCLFSSKERYDNSSVEATTSAEKMLCRYLYIHR